MFIPIIKLNLANWNNPTYGTLLQRSYYYQEQLPLNFNFRFFYQNYTSITITTYGFVYFSHGSNQHSGNSIVGFNYNGDTRYKGGIYYQNLYSGSTESIEIKSTINKIDSNFVPSNIYRITYDNVPQLYYESLVASFQIILTTDLSKYFVILKYTSCLSNSTLSTLPGLYFLNENQTQLSNLLTDPCFSSNVNEIGTWVFDVSSTNRKYFNLKNNLVFFEEN